MEDIADSLAQIIASEVEFPKPRLRMKRKPVRKPSSDPVIETITEA